MTEKIQKAIDKIDQEAEKMGSATVRLLIQKIQQKMSNIQNSHIEIFGVVVVASAIAAVIILICQRCFEKATRKNRIRLEILDEFFPDSKQKK